MSQVTEQSVRFQTALASIKLIQASAVLDLTEDDFDFLTSNKVWIATDRSRARRCVEACVYGTLDFVGYPRFPAPVEFIAAVIAYYVHPVNIQTACLIMKGRSNLWASGYDVDGTDQTSLGQFSGRVQQTYKHSVPRFFVPEHGTMFTLALVRFPPTATKEIQYLNAKGALTYTAIA